MTIRFVAVNLVSPTLRHRTCIFANALYFELKPSLFWKLSSYSIKYQAGNCTFGYVWHTFICHLDNFATRCNGNNYNINPLQSIMSLPRTILIDNPHIANALYVYFESKPSLFWKFRQSRWTFRWRETERWNQWYSSWPTSTQTSALMSHTQ